MRNTATEEDVGVIRIELGGLIVVLDSALKLAARAIGGAADRKCNGQILSAKLPRLDGVGTSGDLLVSGDIWPTRALPLLQRLRPSRDGRHSHRRYDRGKKNNHRGRRGVRRRPPRGRAESGVVAHDVFSPHCGSVQFQPDETAKQSHEAL
jgi:hypothetical protein